MAVLHLCLLDWSERLDVPIPIPVLSCPLLLTRQFLFFLDFEGLRILLLAMVSASCLPYYVY